MATARASFAVLTVEEICTELKISRRTFYEWRAKNTAPRCTKLPNGELRVRVAEFDRWMDSCGEEAA
ncbi:helix-turn-helix transcriptional regulator [Amycolatopsis sp. NPDC059090]|uniref:helix-turn-helix transcriptional regulator n=1 Tax=unclassified Amycolatopsis TaxID=2618356 RepID=UPI00366D449A